TLRADHSHHFLSHPGAAQRGAGRGAPAGKALLLQSEPGAGAGGSGMDGTAVFTGLIREDQRLISRIIIRQTADILHGAGEIGKAGDLQISRIIAYSLSNVPSFRRIAFGFTPVIRKPIFS